LIKDCRVTPIRAGIQWAQCSAGYLWLRALNSSFDVILGAAKIFGKHSLLHLGMPQSRHRFVDLELRFCWRARPEGHDIVMVHGKIPGMPDFTDQDHAACALHMTR
jgi:hypothetical protein